MSTINTYIAAPFGAGLTGLSSSVVATCTDADGTTRSLGTLSFAEQLDAAGNPTTGIYTAIAPVDPTWAYPLLVQFGITGQPGVGAIQFVYASQVSAGPADRFIQQVLNDSDGESVAIQGFVGLTNQYAEQGYLSANITQVNNQAVPVDAQNLLSVNVADWNGAAVSGSPQLSGNAVTLPSTPPSGYGGASSGIAAISTAIAAIQTAVNAIKNKTDTIGLTITEGGTPPLIIVEGHS